MKTGVMIAIAVAVAVLAVIGGGVAGYFIGRAQTSNADEVSRVIMFDKGLGYYGPGPMLDRRQNGAFPGRMDEGRQGVWDNDQPYFQYMLDAYAEALGMTSEELSDELKSGKSLWDLASAKGVASEDFDQFMIDAAKQALDKMVADEVMTQKQADAMLERIQENWQDVNPETCPCFDGFGGRNRMWRWSTP